MAREQDRRRRLQVLAVENERRHTRPAVARALTERLGHQVTVDDFLSHDAIEQSWGAVEEQARFHRVWHRIWGGRLAGEVVATVRALAGRLGGTDAYLPLDPGAARCGPRARRSNPSR